MSDTYCEKHNCRKEVLGGRSAHPSNWYCQQCDDEKRIAELEAQLNNAGEVMRELAESKTRVMIERDQLRQELSATTNEGTEYAVGYNKGYAQGFRAGFKYRAIGQLPPCVAQSIVDNILEGEALKQGEQE